MTSSLETLANLPPAAQINFQAHQERLNQYVTRMAPGVPITTQEGVNMQMLLWNTIKQMLNREGSEFVLHYSEFLRYIREHRKGAFAERYLYRFFEHLRLSATERTNFERLLNLMVITCDPAMRQLALRQVDLRSSLAGLTSDSQRQKIAAYYEL